MVNTASGTAGKATITKPQPVRVRALVSSGQWQKCQRRLVASGRAHQDRDRSKPAISNYSDGGLRVNRQHLDSEDLFGSRFFCRYEHDQVVWRRHSLHDLYRDH